MKAVFIRGWSGSGKTTMGIELVERDKANTMLIEADQYFTNAKTGEYRYNRDEIKDAHAWARLKMSKALREGFNVVICNTFTKPFEMRDYLDVAQRFGADVEVRQAQGDYKNVHGVPDYVVEIQKTRFVPIDKFMNDLKIVQNT